MEEKKNYNMIHEVPFDAVAKETAELRGKILRDTPAGYDPVCYWYQVAEKEKHERMNLQARLEKITKRLVDSAARQKAQIPFDVSNLVEMARDGLIELAINVNITRGAKYEEQEDGGYDD